MEQSGRQGYAAPVEISLEKMRGWDKQEDYTVQAANLDITTGTMGGNTGCVGDGTSRTRYACCGIDNLSGKAITLKYKVIGDSTNTYTLEIAEDASKEPLPPISTIVGTDGSTTAVAVVKLWYKDIEIVYGRGPRNAI